MRSLILSAWYSCCKEKWNIWLFSSPCPCSWPHGTWISGSTFLSSPGSILHTWLLCSVTICNNKFTKYVLDSFPSQALFLYHYPNPWRKAGIISLSRATEMPKCWLLYPNHTIPTPHLTYTQSGSSSQFWRHWHISLHNLQAKQYALIMCLLSSPS